MSTAVVRRNLLLVLLASAASHAIGAEEILSRTGRGQPTFVRGDLGTLPPADGFFRASSAEQTGYLAQVAAFARGFAARSLAASGQEELVVARAESDPLGTFHARLGERLHGLPVYGAELIIHIDSRSGRVYAVNGFFASGYGSRPDPRLSAAAAFAATARGLTAGSHRLVGAAELCYLLVPGGDEPRLAWRALVEHRLAGRSELDEVFAAAEDGELLQRNPQIRPIKSWRTHDAQQTNNLPGRVACADNQACPDFLSTQAHLNTSRTYDFYQQRFGRRSLDDTDRTMVSSVHVVVGTDRNVAEWRNGLVQAAYGDGDGTTFRDIPRDLDIVSHELTHGVTQFEADLLYQNESGALNEAWSDIMAAATSVWLRGTIDGSTWAIGELAYTPNNALDAVRFMNNPTADGVSRDYYPERYTGPQDSGGVHWNSGIANLAFQRLVAGGTHPRGRTTLPVYALGIRKAEQIFYRALTTYLTRNSQFADARTATAQAARDLYNDGEVFAVHQAWCLVGVPNCPAPLPAPVTSVNAATFARNPVAPESIAAAFGSGLANQTLRADTLPLPTQLGGTTVTVKDRAGVERAAGLFFVSPSQVNYLLPAGLAGGAAAISVRSATGTWSVGEVDAARVGPGLFTADASGRGLPTGYLVRRTPQGVVTEERFDQGIYLGPEGEQVRLVLYGTGVRGRSALERVSILGTTPEYAGPAPGFAGLDQVNVLIPRSFAGSQGSVQVSLTADGAQSNVVIITFRTTPVPLR